MSQSQLHFDVRRNKMHFLCDAKESDTVLHLKRLVEGVLSVKPEKQKLAFNETTLEPDSKILVDCGLNAETAGVLEPAVIKLSLKKDDGTFEIFHLDPLSSPPPLVECFRRSEANAGGGDAVQVV